MADTRDAKPRTRRMDAYFTEESYEALRTGEVVFNNGLRSKDGYYWPNQPEYAEPDEEENDPEYLAPDGTAPLMIGGIVVAFIAGVKAVSYIGRFWHDKAAPPLQKSRTNLRGNHQVNRKKFILPMSKQN